jgi:hypothetical protein
METLRIHYLSALLVPIAYAIACGGSDQPAASSSATGGGSNSTGGSSTGNGGSSTGNGGSSTGNGGSAGATGGRGGFMLPMEPIVPDPTCPDLTISPPDGGVTLPDGGMVMIPPGLFGDGGSTTFKGCCDQTGVCGVAIQQSFTFQGMALNISLCATPSDAMGTGFDAGPTKSCTYVAP